MKYFVRHRRFKDNKMSLDECSSKDIVTSMYKHYIKAGYFYVCIYKQCEYSGKRHIISLYAPRSNTVDMETYIEATCSGLDLI